LLLDEPCAGLDSLETKALSETLANVVRESGLSLLMVEHDLEMVLGLASLVYVLDFGVCVATGSPDEIRRDAAVQTAYLGDQVNLEDSK
jgi:branched-chain amino acid transport system ATP-binding protein